METESEALEKQSHLYIINGNNAFLLVLFLISIVIIGTFKFGAYAEKVSSLEDVVFVCGVYEDIKKGGSDGERWLERWKEGREKGQ